MNNEQDKYLEKIFNSKEFKKSENSRILLEYLYKATVKGDVPKEAQIAYDLFQRDVVSDPSKDSTFVRVNIHNLRKKLEHYYFTDGKDDKIKFKIPKGRYTLELIEEINEHKKNRKLGLKIGIAFFLSSVILIIIAISTRYFITESKISDSFIWKDIFDNDKQIMVVLGDYYFFQEYNQELDKRYVVRDYNINSKREFNSFLMENQSNRHHFNEIEFSYLAHGTPYYLKTLIPVIANDDQDFEICLMSRFTTQYLQNYNIIFIGLFKTMGFLDNYFVHSHFSVDLDSNIISLREKALTGASEYHQIGKSETMHDDYSIVARFPGPNGNTILLFTSFNDIGVIQSVKSFTNLDLLAEIETKYKKQFANKAEYFEMLFKVNGINRTELNSEIILIQELDPDINYWDMQ